LLVDRGLLHRIGDGWRLTGDLPREVLPAGVQAVLAARIDSLDAAAKSVLRDASIAGTRFTLDMVRALEPSASEDVVAAGLEELLDRGIVRPADIAAEGGRSFVFAHTLAQDVAYAGIPKAERARRHSQLARWATGEMRGAAGEVDVVVATQAEQACALATEMRLPPDDPAWLARSAGLDALVRLGQAALARDDNVRAEAVFTRALALSDDSVDQGRRDDARIGRSAARVGLHRLDDAETDLTGPRQSDDLRRRAAALVVYGDLLRRRGDVTQAVPALVSALAAASEAGFDRVTGEALRQLGMVDYRSGRLTAAEGRFREALALAQRVGDRRGAGWALQHLAWTATTRGDYDLAERMLGEAAGVFASVDDDGGLSWCAGTEAFVRLLQGRFREARGLARGLLPIGRARDDSWGTAACLTIDAFAAAELGRITAALEQSDTAAGIFRSLGDTWGQALAAVARGAALRGAGRPKDAVKVVRAAVDMAQRAGQPVTAALALSVLGYCRLDLGDLSGAEEAARRALDAAAPLELRPAALVGPKVLLGQVHRRRGELKLALPLLAEAEVCREETSLIFPRRQALAHLAGVRLETGDVAAALSGIEAAFAVPAEDVRSRVVALRVLAQVLTAAGDRPAGLLAGRQAVALAGATEMRSELLASEKVVAKLG
jgi:tetratricopeptide (TPR) repeat protein